MLKNYLITALQGLLKYKLFTLINMLGLAIGLASTIIIGLFVLDELSYDAQFADEERIFRVSRDFTAQDVYLAGNAPLVTPLLKQDFAEVEHAARLFGWQALLSHDDTAFYEDNLRFADNEFFDIFALEWLAGDPAQALLRPSTVVLTESIAARYFGNEAALGQTLLIENQLPLEVTGIIRDLPHNTHLDLNVIASLSTVPIIAGEASLTDWGSNNFDTYIKLRPGADIGALSSQFPAFLTRHYRENAPEFTGMTATPLRDIHLHSTRQNEMKPPGSIGNVYMFSATALFILLIACFNFMNLSTARSSRRGQEVGVRKSMGATRSQIARQFMAESVLLTLLASLLALVFVETALPFFNGVIGKDLALNLFSDLRVPLALFTLVLVVGLISGSYPALYLSAFKPVQVLRGMLATGGSMLFRNALVLLQFSIAIVLVVATLVVLMQMRFAANIELGFQKEQVLLLQGSPTAGLGQQWEALRQELLRHPDILAVTASGQTPLESNANAMTVTVEGEESRTLPFMAVDYDFFSTYQIPVLAGRGFSAAFPDDRVRDSRNGVQSSGNSFVLNRLAVEQYGWTLDEAIGKSLSVFFNGARHLGAVTGVVENSYFESVRSPLKPMLFLMDQHIVDGTATMQYASLRLSGDNQQQTLDVIDVLWQQFMPDYPMARYFLANDFDALFQRETLQASLFRYFSLLAIFIACMGLYGLASFNAERRKKEIGVRKVMGGSVWSIVWLLTNDFSRLVLLANLVAWPIAWFAMNRWLENFAYRIDLTPFVFIGSGLIALCIAWVTVGSTAAKAASSKPVLALRYE